MAKRKRSRSKARKRTRAPRSKARTRKRAKRSRLAIALTSFRRALKSKRPARVERAALRAETELAASWRRARVDSRLAELQRERRRVAIIRRGVLGEWTDAERSRAPWNVREIVGSVLKPIPDATWSGKPVGHYLKGKPRIETTRVHGFAPIEEMEDAFGKDARTIRGIVIKDKDTEAETWIRFEDPLEDYADLYPVLRDYYAKTGFEVSVWK